MFRINLDNYFNFDIELINNKIFKVYRIGERKDINDRKLYDFHIGEVFFFEILEGKVSVSSQKEYPYLDLYKRAVDKYLKLINLV